MDKYKQIKLCNFGISFLDDYLHGITSNDLIVIGAGSGCGKTSLANTISRNAVLQNVPTALLSLENTAGDWERQIIFTKFKQNNPSSMTRREFNEDYSLHIEKYSDYKQDIDIIMNKKDKNEIKLFSLIQSNDGINNLEKLTKILNFLIDKGKKIIIIDHIDHISTDSGNDLQFIRSAMKMLAELAFTKNICIITFSQVAKIVSPKVMSYSLSDLRGGADKVNLATVVVTIKEEPQYHDELHKRKSNLIAIRKDRYGSNHLARVYYKLLTGAYEQNYYNITNFDANGYVVDGLTYDKLDKIINKQ